jgi:hypothetical protein
VEYTDEDSDTIDAVRFVALTEGLRDAFARVASARLEGQQRDRWHRRLGAITDTARRNLAGAQAQLDRFDEDWAREVRN